MDERGRPQRARGARGRLYDHLPEGAGTVRCTNTGDHKGRPYDHFAEGAGAVR